MVSPWRRVAAWSLLTAVLLASGACGPSGDAELSAPRETAAEPAAILAEPAFHHLHLNAVDPVASLDWWQTAWPAGEVTEVAGFPAFAADGRNRARARPGPPRPWSGGR